MSSSFPTGTIRRWIVPAFVALAAACSSATDVGDDLTVPAPGILVSEPLGQTSIRLRWASVTGNNIRRYRVLRRTDLSGPFAVVDSVPASGSQLVYLDSSLEPETFYGYRVEAVDVNGRASGTSLASGAKTAPRPSIEVAVITDSPSELLSASDPDGYAIAIRGPDSATATVPATASPGARTLFSPLRPGRYTVFARGLADNCIRGDENTEVPSDSIASVEVTDQGLATRKTVNQLISCFDPQRARLAVQVTVQNGTSASAARVNLSLGGTTPYNKERTLTGAGGTASFRNLLPGSYQVDIRGLASNCQVVGGASRVVSVAAAQAATEAVTVNCNVVNTQLDGEDAGPEDASKPYKIRYQWSDSSAAPGSQVQLTMSFDRGTGAPLASGLGGVTGSIRLDPSVLEFVSGAATAPFSITVANNEVVVGTRGISIATATPASGATVGLAVLTYRVKAGTTGRRITTTTVLNEVSDGDGNPFTTQVQPRGRILVVGASTTTPPPTDTTTTPPPPPPPPTGTQPPVAVIAGQGQLSTLVGTPFLLSSSGTSDPQNLPLTYTWSVSPTTASFSDPAAPNPTITFGAAGTYTLILSVKNSANQLAFTSRTIIALAQPTGGTNIPPSAVIDGTNPLRVATGVDLDLSARGSSDADGTITAYNWVLTGGSPASATGVTARVRYIVPGTYTIRLSVTDNRGATTETLRTVEVTGTPVQPFTLTHEFSDIVAGEVVMTATLDLTFDLPETPGPEEITGASVATITWNPAVLQFKGLDPVDNFNVSTTNTVTSSTITQLNSRVIGTSFPRGRFPIYRVRFRVLNAAGTSDVAVTGLSATPGPNASPVLANYGPLVTISPGRFPQPTGTVQTFGTVRGTITRGGTGSQDLAGIQVDIVPSATGAATRTVVGVGSGSSLTYTSTDVPVGTGAGAGTGQVRLRNLPVGCLANTSNYNGLSATTEVVLDIVVNCSAPAATGSVQGAIVRSGTGTQDLSLLTVNVTPTGGVSQGATVSGSGASVSYSVTGVPVGSGSGAVTVGNVPSGCTIPAAVPYSGLTGGGVVTVTQITVTCTASAGSGSVAGSITRSGTGTQDLAGVTVSVTPTGGSAVTAIVSGSGGTVSYSASTVPVGSGSGTVTVSNVPAGCTAPATASYSGLSAGGTVTVPAIAVTCTAAGPTAVYRHRAQWGAIAGGVVDLTLTWDPTACLPSSNPNCGFPTGGSGSNAFGGFQAAIGFSGAAVARLTTPTGRPTTNFGTAVVGTASFTGATPSIGISAASTATNITAQDYAIVRFTVVAGAAGTVTTSSSLSEVSTPLGDPFPIVASGASQNTVYEEGTLTIP